MEAYKPDGQTFLATPSKKGRDAGTSWKILQFEQSESSGDIFQL
jgi:hypothetical protein